MLEAEYQVVLWRDLLTSPCALLPTTKQKARLYFKAGFFISVNLLYNSCSHPSRYRVVVIVFHFSLRNGENANIPPL